MAELQAALGVALVGGLQVASRAALIAALTAELGSTVLIARSLFRVLEMALGLLHLLGAL